MPPRSTRSSGRAARAVEGAGGGHRAPFIDPAPAPRGAGVSFSRVPCGTRALSTAAI
eukprot:COSAG02_NODE_48722_length_331_cov_13.288793_1_plen_56_part_01